MESKDLSKIYEAIPNWWHWYSSIYKYLHTSIKIAAASMWVKFQHRTFWHVVTC